jgi:Bacterial Ig-like domain
MEIGWIHFEAGRSGRPRHSSARLASVAEIERLEGRALLAITVGPISASAGTPFTGLVATLAQTDVTGNLSDINASIAWGDGQSSPGSVSLVNQSLLVQATHTYAAMGTYPLLVTVTGTTPSQISGQGTATVAETKIMLMGGTITPSLGQPFSGTVASFTDSYTGLSASSYSAVITWGDGHNTPGQILPNGTGGYNVVGSNTYASAPVAGSTKVQVVRSVDGETASANVTVLVNAASGTFSGMLDPASDTGVSNTDGITSINQPTFVGTATPYAIVQLLARPQGQSNLVSLGQTVTDPTGQWSLTVGPMLDGVYSIFANVAPPQGFPVQVVPISANNQIVIDTVGPRVVSVVPDLRNHQILVSFQDNLSGLDLSTLTNPANYVLIGPHPRRAAPITVSLVPSAAVLTTDPQMVVINTNSPFPVRGLRIVPGGIRDIAGNPLNGQFRGRFPSGGHPQGRSFVYHF